MSRGMERRFSLFVYLFALGVFAGSVILDPDRLSELLAVSKVTPTEIAEINAIRLLFSLGSSMILLIALIWTFGRNYSFAEHIRSGYFSWTSPVRGLKKSDRYWVWRWILGLWGLVIFIVMTQSVSIRYGKQAWFDGLALHGGLIEAVQIVVLLAAGALLIQRAWMDVRLGVAPLGVVGILFGLFLVVAAGEEAGWGSHLLGGGGEAASSLAARESRGDIVDYGLIWIRQAPVLVMLFYIALWSPLGYLFPQLHYLLDRMALPIAPLALFPIAAIGLTMNDHSPFNLLWQRSEWPISEGRELLLSGSLLMMVMFMRRYRGDAEVDSNALAFQKKKARGRR